VTDRPPAVDPPLASSQHVSVMPRESLAFLAIQPGMTVVDVTPAFWLRQSGPAAG
jgi:predicted methyltransferase